MVMVSRNLERANDNDGFKMSALEIKVNNMWMYPLYRVAFFTTTKLLNSFCFNMANF